MLYFIFNKNKNNIGKMQKTINIVINIFKKIYKYAIILSNLLIYRSI